MVGTIPLFPLDLVLFPGAPLPLHIFEPRYKEMIGECLTEKKEFGIIRVVNEGVAFVGCTASITTVLKKYPDGRLDILTHGERRFELLEVKDGRTFFQAEVLFFEDDSADPAEAEVAEALTLQNELLKMLGADPLRPPTGVPLNSFLLAASMPLDLDFKQRLLQSRIESERLAMLIDFYRLAVPQLREKLAREGKGGNGWVH